MRRLLFGLMAALAMALALPATVAFAGNSSTGNGAPSGPHYDLNIHGTTGPVDRSTTSNGHDIFVPLSTSGNDSATAEDCDDIQLQQGTTFGVINPDCWTGIANHPQFQLPPPCASTTASSCTTAYTVWAKALTKGSATMQTCYTDTTGSTYCATGAQIVSLQKKTGTGGFTDVTPELLFYCSSATNKLQPIFSPSNYTYFWDYDNSGLRLAQLRFYQTSETVNYTNCTYSTSI